MLGGNCSVAACALHLKRHPYASETSRLAKLHTLPNQAYHRSPTHSWCATKGRPLTASDRDCYADATRATYSSIGRKSRWLSKDDAGAPPICAGMSTPDARRFLARWTTPGGRSRLGDCRLANSSSASKLLFEINSVGLGWHPKKS